MFSNKIKPIVITSGEPSGIGIDLCAMLPQFHLDIDYVLIGNLELFRQRTQEIGLSTQFIPYGQVTHPEYENPNYIKVIDVSLAEAVKNGIPNPKNALYVLNMLDRAIQGCLSHEFSAVVTCPIHKGVINDSGIPFSGHTEYLAEKTNTERVVMMLTGANMRMALATTHLPLRDVSNAITPDSLKQTIQIIYSDLIHKYCIPNPRIFVAGLNPHAGENGHLGSEEIDIIIPVIEELKQQGLNIFGPYPADTLFTQKYLHEADCFLAMYHDQGLPVLKHTSFGMGINITLGLPIIRTSVDHGTAFDLVGTGYADCGSLLNAIKLAHELALKQNMSD